MKIPAALVPARSDHSPRCENVVCSPNIAPSFAQRRVPTRTESAPVHRRPHTGMTMYDPTLTRIPAAAVAAEDADLLDHLTGQGHVRMKLTLTPRRCPTPRATT